MRSWAYNKQAKRYIDKKTGRFLSKKEVKRRIKISKSLKKYFTEKKLKQIKTALPKQSRFVAPNLMRVKKGVYFDTVKGKILSAREAEQIIKKYEEQKVSFHRFLFDCYYYRSNEIIFEQHIIAVKIQQTYYSLDEYKHKAIQMHAVQFENHHVRDITYNGVETIRV
jgi:hypothetical protein